MSHERTPAKRKARQLAKYLRAERPDYAYLKQLFRYLRLELGVVVPRASHNLPQVLSEEEIQRFYDAVWQSQNLQDMIIIKTFLYTGVRVSELVNIRLADIDWEQCQIRIHAGKGGKDRIVPFPLGFKEALALHAERMHQAGATYLFESSWKRKYSDRGIRKMVRRYGELAGLSSPVSPHRLRHFLLTWLKQQGIDDALIQPYSGHVSRQSLEVYSRLALTQAQQEYNAVIGRFPV
ncbi:MAG: site-specific integrase [Chloroflexota bacterium]|nr:site-specific integrase [Chloroflexota bacterium]